MGFFERIAELERQRAAFAVATVVARRSPVSSHLGDRAIVHADGRMEGFVGGSCSRDLVRRHALLALRSAQPRLLQIRPADDEGTRLTVSATQDGERVGERVVVPMGCASNGAADIYIEPHLPMRILVVVGFTPVAQSLARLAAASGDLDVIRVVNDEELRDVDEIAGVRVLALGQLSGVLSGLEDARRERLAAIVASQGHYDEIALEKILRAGGIGFCGLVASRKRAADVFGVLMQSGFDHMQLAAVRNPVGLDIGARSASDVAISILAELIAHAPAIVAEPPELATDPVCGMDVEVATARHRASHGGQRFFFCGAGCLATFAQEPARYADAAQTW